MWLDSKFQLQVASYSSPKVSISSSSITHFSSSIHPCRHCYDQFLCLFISSCSITSRTWILDNLTLTLTLRTNCRGGELPKNRLGCLSNFSRTTTPITSCRLRIFG